MYSLHNREGNIEQWRTLMTQPWIEGRFEENLVLTTVEQAINWARQFGILFNQRASQLTDQFLRIADAWEAGAINKLSEQDQIAYTTMFTGIDTLRVTHFGIVRNGVAWRDQEHISEYNGPPTPTMISSDAYLKKIELETFANIIIGGSPLSAFDKFVEDWRKNGGEEITAEVLEWEIKTYNIGFSHFILEILIIVKY